MESTLNRSTESKDTETALRMTNDAMNKSIREGKALEKQGGVIRISKTNEEYESMSRIKKDERHNGGLWTNRCNIELSSLGKFV